MSSESLTPPEAAKKAFSNIDADTYDATEFDLRRVDGGYLATSPEFDMRVLTEWNNPSRQMFVLGSQFAGIENPHGFASAIEAKRNLQEKGILSSEGDLQFSYLREPVGDFFDLYGNDLKDSVNGRNHYGAEIQRRVANRVDEIDKTSVKAYEVSEGTDLHPKTVGRVFGQWEREYDLNPERYRLGGAHSESWRVQLLREEEVISDLLED